MFVRPVVFQWFPGMKQNWKNISINTLCPFFWRWLFLYKKTYCIRLNHHPMEKKHTHLQPKFRPKNRRKIIQVLVCRSRLFFLTSAGVRSDTRRPRLWGFASGVVKMRMPGGWYRYQRWWHGYLEFLCIQSLGFFRNDCLGESLIIME